MIEDIETAGDLLPLWMLLSAAFGFVIGDAFGDSTRHRKDLEETNVDLREQLENVREQKALEKEPVPNQTPVTFDAKGAAAYLDQLEGRLNRLEQNISRHQESPASILKHLTAVIHDTHKQVVAISKALQNQPQSTSPKVDGAD